MREAVSFYFFEIDFRIWLDLLDKSFRDCSLSFSMEGRASRLSLDSSAIVWFEIVFGRKVPMIKGYTYVFYRSKILTGGIT